MHQYITFDLDETLMQNPFSKWVFPEIDRLVAPHLELKDGILPEIKKEHRKRLEQAQDAAAYDWDDILKQILVEKNIPITIDIAELVQKHAVDPKVYLLENDALTVLEELKSRGYLLGVVTNGFYKYQVPVMETIQLVTYIDKIITPCNTGYCKPEIKMADRLLEEGEIIAHVGDRLDHDVYFANQLGALSILIDHQMPEAVRRISPDRRVEQKDYLKTVFQQKKYGELVPEENYLPKIVIYSIRELLDIELTNPS